MVSISENLISWFEIGREIVVVMVHHQNAILTVFQV